MSALIILPWVLMASIVNECRYSLVLCALAFLVDECPYSLAMGAMTTLVNGCPYSPGRGALGSSCTCCPWLLSTSSIPPKTLSFHLDKVFIPRTWLY